jgi:hypothetical protein
MSTSPERISLDDRIVSTISRWLTHRLSDESLRDELQAVPLERLTPEQADAVRELQEDLAVGIERAGLEMVARETLETVAIRD